MLDKLSSVVIALHGAVSTPHLAKKSTETIPNSDLAAAQLMTRMTARLNCHLHRLLLPAGKTAGGTVGRALVVADAVLTRSLAAPSPQKWPEIFPPIFGRESDEIGNLV